MGILKRSVKEDNVLLIRVILSPFERYSFFHPASIHSIISTIDDDTP
jgi:hypothetical protein